MATLLENWRNLAYGNGLDDKQREQLGLAISPSRKESTSRS